MPTIADLLSGATRPLPLDNELAARIMRTGQLPTIGDIVSTGMRPQPGPMQGPAVPGQSFSNWQPRPTSPFGGLEAFAWKDPRVQPQSIGNDAIGPSQEQLRLLRLMAPSQQPSQAWERITRQ